MENEHDELFGKGICHSLIKSDWSIYQESW